MRKLNIKLDRIAGLRQLRNSLEPDPVAAAVICELNGADGISVRLRTEQVSVQPRDIKLLRQIVQTELNLEIPNRQDCLTLAQKYQPDLYTIIPAFQEGNLMQSGLKLNRNLQDTIAGLRENGTRICLLIEPDPLQIKQALKLDIQAIEICIGNYTMITSLAEKNKELNNIRKSAEFVHEAKLHCAVGHGLDYKNIRDLAAIKEINEFRIGYAFVARSIFSGLSQAVRDLREIIDA
jgi:pyridoxine 5-phosphate synthase